MKERHIPTLPPGMCISVELQQRLPLSAGSKVTYMNVTRYFIPALTHAESANISDTESVQDICDDDDDDVPPLPPPLPIVTKLLNGITETRGKSSKQFLNSLIIIHLQHKYE